MLRRLNVSNYVLIDSLDIEFPEGLVIITGQTGAGKSILLGALNLALGAKADASVIGENGTNCVVEAEFVVDRNGSEVAGLLDENGIDLEDNGTLVVRRVVSAKGRSRSFINDCPVTVQVLSSLAGHLVDIHSQHQTLMLSDRQFRLSVLDLYAENEGLLDEFRAAYSEQNRLESELAAIDKAIARASEEKEYNESRLAMLESASLKDGELESLEAEQKQLANAGEIKENLCGAENLFYGTSDEVPGVDAMLKEMEKLLEKTAGYVPEVSRLTERIASCRVELDDVMSEICSLNSNTEVSQERLSAVEERLSLLYGLLQRFSCVSIQELVSERDSLSQALVNTADMEERRKSIAASLAEVQGRVSVLASRLHESRSNAASAFSDAVTDSIRFLELPYAVFKVDIAPAEMSSSGIDAVSFLFSATGKNPSDVSKASGGEMSRIMLSLKAMMARYMDMPTMVFDEIDTGVSGSVADKMGSMICEMGKDMQVFAITHLPQVAAKGEAHYLVTKEIDPETSNAVTAIKKLSAEQRVLEVARMLSGAELTDAAVENARSLLNAAHSTIRML